MECEVGKFLNFPKDLIECPVCFGTFDQPKVLPCQHNFCLSCLDRLRNPDNQVTCPICQRIAALPPDGASQLPTNFFLVQLLDASKPSEVVAKDAICDACVSSTSRLTTAGMMYCVECAQSLCKTCIGAHTGIRSLRHHQLIGIDEKDPERLKKLLISRPAYCTDHPNSEIAFHCRECSTSICVKCAFLRHRNHDCVDIREKAEEARQEIDQMVEKISQTLTDCKSAKQELYRDLATVDEIVKRIQKQITDKTNQVIVFIRRQEKNLLKTVEKFEKQFKSPVEISIKDAESMVGNLETFVQFCRQTKDFGTHTDVIRLWPQIIRQGKEFQAMSMPRTTRPDLAFSPSTEKIDEINVLGDVEIRTLDERSEICTDYKTMVSHCYRDQSSSVPCADSNPHSTTPLETVQKNDTIDEHQGIQAQGSLKNNDGETEPLVDFSSDCRLRVDYLFEEKRVCCGADYEYQQHVSAVVTDETRIERNDSIDSNTLNSEENSCKERHEKIIRDPTPLKANRRVSVEIEGTIAGRDPVMGIAVLDRLYVLRQTSNRLESYDLRTLNHIALLEFDEVRQPTDLTACPSTGTLYIGHTKKVVFSLKVTNPNSTPERLAVALSYKHLSVTADCSVLMGCLKSDKILEYKEMPVWTELRRICISGSCPTSMVQISSNFFVVSSRMNVLYFVRMSGRRVDYECVPVPHNISHIAADVGRSQLLVANRYGHSILRLDPSSSASTPRSSPIVGRKRISQPSRLWSDRASGRLFVGTANGDVKILRFT